MATDQISVEQQVDKGLKSGALGLVSTTIIATASVAPAYSIAATLVFVVGFVGLQSPAIAVLAFVPMLLTSIGYSELNKADPDCGTTFTWATRAFGPRTGWAGGWGIIAADVLVMASLAQVAGQYGFLLFNAKGIGSNPTSGWVLLVGVRISDPGICQHARRVEFEDLAVAFKSLHPVGGSRFLRYEIPVAAAETSVHLPLVDRAVFIGKPAHQFSLVG